MKNIIFALLPLLLLSCAEKKEAAILPKPPVSAESIQKDISGKQFFSTRIGLVSPFELETKPSYDWIDDMKDTTTFFQTYLSERKMFALSFQNDSIATLVDEGKTIHGTYKIDNEKKEDEKDGFKLRISYTDSSMAFPGATEPMIMTSAFTISGADANSLFLELPREYNNRKVVTLLTAK